MADPTVLAFDQQEYSRTQLDALAAGMAASLERRGVGPGDRVALMSSNRPEFVIAALAIWQLGAVVVLISPAWKRAEVTHALDVSEATHAVGDSSVLADLMPMLCLDDQIEEGFRPPTPAESDADALLVFSSGTTGLPKAVRHTHASFAAAVGHWRDALKLTASDRIQIVTPPSHILGLLNIVTALDAGTWMRLHRRFDLDAMLRHIESDRITVEMAVAPIALGIASHPDLESFDLTSLRYIMWGATPVTPSVAETVTRRTGVPWVPAYGASEIPVIACSPIEGARLDSVGRVVPGVEMRVVSLGTGETLAPGDTGEIQVRSASMMAGYLPGDTTADAFADGWYRTGDVGSVDADGWVRITDRSKDMIKVKGFQVAPAEIEAVLFTHPDIADCAVFGVDDAATGEAVVAAVTTTAPIEAGEIIDLVGNTLASYKRPSRVVFVPEIPRLPSGKVLRRILEERHGRTSDQ
ncbi:acyl--CoA ligase [Rhodococcus sp. HNM0563]|uniref:class I adenylate-forming enzyme family protein n=1 Tax=unclassified Rhodococcus (in: high G+C Gram-positive bacteria) TaxID=192944 RepID=UPI00146EBEEE|nr:MULTISPECIES: AMP-binding protein [unclassified Rhodococcus (in: high G+C Gram-positive bacteria)]MCK0092048.1 AMP-binding protein [Rhodococcus sp. F64268]NLU65558.1 acyl--CoA ligase [Rhodococcus sp. HNM0563]